MAGWWLPWRQLDVLRRIDAGEVVKCTGSASAFWWNEGGGCTPQGKALLRRGLVTMRSDFSGVKGIFIVEVTPTGKNELGYHRNLTKDHYEKKGTI